MPVFGLGTWRMGGDMNLDPTDDQVNIKAVKAAIDSGITHIDTAEKYAEGHAEEIVGQAITGYDRSKLFIVSKVADGNLRYDDVLKSFASSLKRLQTDYLDLYLIHAPNPKISIQETMRAMDKLKAEGLIKAIGVSNFNVSQMKEAQANSQNKIVANQLHYNLIVREVERKGILAYCQKNDIFLIAWRPLDTGSLAKPGMPVLDRIGKKYHKSPAQVAINWLISQTNVVTLSKMKSAIHLQDNLGATNWQMDKNDIEELIKEYPGQKDVSDVCPLL
ncbi:MAG: aldo/keto reductase [Patescibacteria group bacterium]